jgi:hypothetical protein
MGLELERALMDRKLVMSNVGEALVFSLSQTDGYGGLLEYGQAWLAIGRSMTNTDFSIRCWKSFK